MSISYKVVTIQPIVIDHGDDLVNELGVLVGFIGQRTRSGENGFDVHIPESPDQFPHGGFLFALDPLSLLPDDVSHEAGNVDGIVAGTFAKMLDEPFFGLVMNQLVVVTDAGFTETGVQGRQLWGHESIKQEKGLFYKGFLAVRGENAGRGWKIDVCGK